MLTVNRGLLSVGLCLVLAACAAGVTSEVTRFHRGALPLGETVAIVPLDEAKQGGIEFAAYERLVADVLEAIGYRVVEPGSDPAMLARMDYAVGPAQTRIQDWSGSYVHYHFYRGHFYPWYFGTYWDEPRVYGYSVYPRSLDLVMARASGEVVFEGHVRSVGQEQNLNEVMPYMVTAMFQNFPGESGVTKVVTIRRDGERAPY